MDPHLFWAVALFLIGVAIVGIELFVPSGGVLGVLAAGSIIASVVVGYMGGGLLGTSMLIAVVVLIPLLIVGLVQIWPHTPIGKRILIRSDEVPREPLNRGLKALEGRIGMSKTKMLPSGSIEIDGKTIDAVADGMPLDPGQLVRVISVTSNRVLVRPATAQEALDAVVPDHPMMDEEAESVAESPAAGSSPAAIAEASSERAKNAFSPHLENLELDSLD